MWSICNNVYSYFLYEYYNYSIYSQIVNLTLPREYVIEDFLNLFINIRRSNLPYEKFFWLNMVDQTFLF